MALKQKYQKDAKQENPAAPKLQSEVQGFVNKTNQPPTDDISGSSSYVGKGNPLYGGI